MTIDAPTIACAEGFQITVLPSSAGTVGRFPPIAVKLNGVTAYTKPSSGRYSIRFQASSPDSGCSSSSRRMLATLNRRKSASSQAASASASETVFDWSSIVAATSRAR